MILVTGGNGFVGRQIVESLIDSGKDVKLVVRNESVVSSRIKECVEIIYTQNLFNENFEWWKNVLVGVDVVIHAAWYNEPGKYLQSEMNIDCLNGTINLARACISGNIKKFVGIGTCFEYDLDRGVLSTKTPLIPRSMYAACKVSTYLLLKNLFKLNGIKFAWCRLFYLYGDGENKKRLVPYIRSQIKKGQVVELTSGNQIRDFMDVKDAARTIASISGNSRVGAINICSGVPITVRQLAERIADEYGRRDLLKFGVRPDNIVDPICVVGASNENTT
jgi:dTDP-6-deoxy-L-talose 4-dehydrogenase (NAD+)